LLDWKIALKAIHCLLYAIVASSHVFESGEAIQRQRGNYS